MIFNIKLNCTEEELCTYIDRFIRDDCEYELPAYGSFKSYPKGFHFRRKGKRIRGLYRKSSLDGTTLAKRYMPISNHTNFYARIVRKKGKASYLRGFCYPQYYLIFLAALLFTLGILFSLGDISRTMPIVTGFLCAFLFIFLEIMNSCISTSRLLIKFIRECKN
ncbi:MAG: hypothetical protein E7575_01995 [Ruminococcaceae bacterium]|nr:hypothetical protein [Oscillospiraceae bacterium]